jgi:hypothetical protein
MTPEEILNKQIWEILQDIKEEYLITEKLQYVRFRTPHVVGVGIIPPDRKVAILRKLDEWKAIKIKGQDAYGYLLSINDQEFNELYNKYAKINNPQEDLQAAPSQEYFLTNSDLVESLERQYSNLIKLPEKGFFLGIGDYVKFIDENSGFKLIISTIDGFREKDKTKLDELEKALLKDVASVEKTVIDRVKKKNITSELIKKRIEEYEMTKDGRMQSGEPKVKALHDSFSLVLMSLHENGYEKLVSEFIEIAPDSKSIADYRISDRYHPYCEELQEFRAKVQKTIWGSWNELVIAYLVIHKYKERMRELTEENDFAGQMNFYLLHKEMENVLGNASDEPRRLQFIKDDYIIHIGRIHNFIINKLNSEPEKNAEQEEKGQDLDERYMNLINEIKAGNRASDLDSKYQELLEEIKSQGYSNPSLINQTIPQLGTYKLKYSSDNGFAHFNGAEHIFTGRKARALLSVMNQNKGTPYTVDGIKQKCNPLISKSRLHFRTEKDIYDTVMSIRKALKVNKGEFFPIQKLEDNWIWIEK